MPTGLDKSIMARISCCNIIRSIFTALKILCSIYLSLPLPNPSLKMLILFLWLLLFYYLLMHTLVSSLVDGIGLNLCFVYAAGSVLKICVLYLSLAICFRGKSEFFMSLALKLHRFQVFLVMHQKISLTLSLSFFSKYSA